MKTLISLVILWFLFMEIAIRFFVAPDTYSSCMEKQNLWEGIKSEYCSCRKDVIVSNRYEMLSLSISSVINGKDGSVKYESIPDYRRCIVIKNLGIEKKIENTLEQNLKEVFFKHLPQTDKNSVRSFRLNNYKIIRDVESTPFTVDVEFTVSHGVGIVMHKRFKGKMYYNYNGDLRDYSWRKISSNADAGELFNFIDKVKEITN